MVLITNSISNISISNETFKYVKIVYEDIRIKVSNGKNFREYRNLNNWKQTCCINEIDSCKECYNFQISGTQYCKQHENGIQNEIISTIKKGDEIEDHVCELFQQCSNL